MNDLITINKSKINGAEVNSVNSRDVHDYLEVKTAFSNWIRRAIEKYDFVENDDFITIITDAKSGKREYIVTMDMAKELCMLENNPKGKDTRKYFIRVDKEAKQMQFKIPQTYSEALRLSADLADKNNKLTHSVQEKDKIILAVADLNIKAGDVSFADFAKNLALKNMGRNNVIKFCKARNYLMDNLTPYQPYVNVDISSVSHQKKKWGEMNY